MMNTRTLLSAIFAAGLVASGAAFAQGTAAGNNAGAAGSNNTSPGTTGSGNAPAERMGGSTTMGNPTTPSAPATGLGTRPVTPGGSTTSTPGNNAVNTAPQNNPGAPAAGANSFTEGQARSRIADKGFSQIKNLKLDQKGVWRGTASKDGKSVSVAMDYQGNVVTQ